VFSSGTRWRQRLEEEKTYKEKEIVERYGEKGIGVAQ
jgi:hypothetical protein